MMKSNAKLFVRMFLTILLMLIFTLNLLCVFMVEIPESMQTISSVIVGATGSMMVQAIGYWFDSTEANDSQTNGTKP
jgi:putative flippase GtrA